MQKPYVSVIIATRNLQDWAHEPVDRPTHLPTLNLLPSLYLWTCHSIGRMYPMSMVSGSKTLKGTASGARNLKWSQKPAMLGTWTSWLVRRRSARKEDFQGPALQHTILFLRPFTAYGSKVPQYRVNLGCLYWESQALMLVKTVLYRTVPYRTVPCRAVPCRAVPCRTVPYRTIPVLYCTVLYCTVLYCTVLYYTILYYTILYYTILYYTILYYTILYYTILYYTILYYTILYYTILYYTILYYTILYYTILYYTILYYTILYYTILYYTLSYWILSYICCTYYITVLGTYLVLSDLAKTLPHP